MPAREMVVAGLVEDALRDGEDLEEAVGVLGADDLVEGLVECGVVRHLSSPSKAFRWTGKRTQGLKP